MQTKILEIRDEMTFIPCLAIKMFARNPEQAYYIYGRCGYPRRGDQVMVTHLSGEQMASADPYFWRGRTWLIAHKYIIENFDTLKDGDVVDVSFILNETKEPKTSERFDML